MHNLISNTPLFGVKKTMTRKKTQVVYLRLDEEAVKILDDLAEETKDKRSDALNKLLYKAKIIMDSWE